MIVIRISSLFVTRKDKNEKTIEKKNKNYRLLLSLPVLFFFLTTQNFPTSALDAEQHGTPPPLFAPP